MERVLAAFITLLALQARLVVSDDPVARRKGEVVELTDSNFDELVQDGVWLIDIYAPWCSHCRQLEPAWRLLAEQGIADNINVAKVDGTKNKILLQRFDVKAYPSIFLIRGQRAWTYTGPRSVPAFKAFALDGYKSATALAAMKTPTSVAGRIMGKLYRIPSRVQGQYKKLKEDLGYSDMVLTLGFLAVPVVLGGIIICVLDVVYVRRARQGADEEDEHEHRD